MEMFDEIVRAKASPKVAEKRLTEEEEKMQIAVRAFVIAERRFKKVDADPRKVSDRDTNVRWWDALEDLYVCDKALWEMFVGEVKTPSGNRQYAQFRETLLSGGKLRADA
jgi:hypothetical protein